MIKIKIFRSLSAVISILIILFLIGGANAGSALDTGVLVGTPEQVNFIAWFSFFSPPLEIVTEDAFNSVVGVNQGYQDGVWVFEVDPMANTFTTPPLNTMTVLFGGLGADSGSKWTYTFGWTTGDPITDHGTVGTPGTATCPTMLQGLQNESGKTINWSGTSSEHLIFRTVNPSGAGNGASNGLYTYVATVPSETFTYVDAACPTGADCWHIVIPSSGGIPTGCHSEESSPTAITLSAFSASSHLNSPWVLTLGVGLLAVMSAAVIILRRRSKIVS